MFYTYELEHTTALNSFNAKFQNAHRNERMGKVEEEEEENC